jgi:hypothetical protein
VRFVCRFGNDSYADMLRQELAGAGVDVSGCDAVHHLGSGQGIVMLEPDGAASSIVVGGANLAWGEVRREDSGEQHSSRRGLTAAWVGLVASLLLGLCVPGSNHNVVRCSCVATATPSCCLDTLCNSVHVTAAVAVTAGAICVQGAPLRPAALAGVGVLMLQREVPEAVNLAAAQAAAAAGIPIMLVSGCCCWSGGQSDGTEHPLVYLTQEQRTSFNTKTCAVLWCAVLPGCWRH